jgi:type 1 glutamine amidotransferase
MSCTISSTSTLSIHVLIKIDETSYTGGANGDKHPFSWYHDFDGGRAFYTALGHTDETWSDPLFLHHLLSGIQYAMGTAKWPASTPNMTIPDSVSTPKPYVGLTRIDPPSCAKS